MSAEFTLDQPVQTRERLLDAARLTLGRFGIRHFTLSDVAESADLSRMTLYRYFPSKDALLEALAAHDQQRFDDGLAAAISVAPRRGRRDAALVFIADFQDAYAHRGLIEIEPGFVLQCLTAGLPSQRRSYSRHLGTSEETADLVVRTALSYFLMPTSREDLLRALRAAASAKVAG